jgi:hypothetical protein
MRACRGVRALRWHDVVGVQKLLEVMATDVPAVSERVQRLLLPSYFPDAAAGPALVAALLRASPHAGRAFCHYLAGVHQPAAGGAGAAMVTAAGPAVGRDSLVALARDLTAHLLDVPLATAADLARASKGGTRGRAKRKQAGVGGEPRGEAGPQAGEGEGGDAVETAESWEGILGGLEAVCCGLGTLMAVGDADGRAADRLLRGDALTRLLARCPSAAARCRVAAIAAALPRVPGAAAVRSDCLLRLLGEGGAAPEEAAAALDCVAADPAARALLLRAVAAAFGADPSEVAPAGDGADAAAGGAKAARGRRKALAAAEGLEGRLAQAAAARHVGALLELQGPREEMLASGTLSRLLPWIEAALGARVGALAAAVAAGAGADEEGGGQGVGEAGAALSTYLRACLHLFLSAPPAEEAAEEGGARGADARAQALQGAQQAIEWAAALLRALARADGAALAAAVVSARAGCGEQHTFVCVSSHQCTTR